MSVVTVQLGQCGNQVGCELFHTFAREATDSYCIQAANTSNSLFADPFHADKLTDAFSQSLFRGFFREPELASAAAAASGGGDQLTVARAVLIDMEPKAINQTLTHARSGGIWRYDDASVFCKQSGSANNWAFGYSKHAPNSAQAIADRIQSEVERADSLAGFLLLMSLAGGTGSGVGAYVTELLRDMYSDAFIINQVIYPYSVGEVIVQHYNTLLTLSHLYASSDGLILFCNDILEHVCRVRLALKHPSFAHINSLIAQQMSNVLCPAYTYPLSPPPRPESILPNYATPTHSSAAQRKAAEEKKQQQQQQSSGAGSSSAKKLTGAQKEKRLQRRIERDEIDLISRSYALNSGGATRCTPVSPFTDPITHLFSHPAYKLSTVTSIPQVSTGAKPFDSLSWTYLCKTLHQMHITHSVMQDGINWQIALHNTPTASAVAASAVSGRKSQLFSPTGTGTSSGRTTKSADSKQTTAAAAAASDDYPATNKSVAAMLFLRGTGVVPPPKTAATATATKSDGKRSTAGAAAASGGSESVSETIISDDDIHKYFTDSRLYAAWSRDSPLACSDDDDCDTPRVLYDATASDAKSAPAAMTSRFGFASAASFPSAVAAASDPVRYTPSALFVARHPKPLHNDERSATIWSNSQSMLPPIEELCVKAWTKFQSGAYLHHYAKYGVDSDAFRAAFVDIEQVIADYKAL